MPSGVFCFSPSSFLNSFETDRSKPRDLTVIFIQKASLEKSANVTWIIAGGCGGCVSEFYLSACLR